MVSAHLDHDAAVYADGVQTSDLAASGWKVTGPTPAADGGVDFTASKGFANSSQAKAIVAQLSGAGGPFRGLVIDSDNSLFESTTSVRGTVDLSCGLQCFSDSQLQQALGGAPNLGIDPSALQSDFGVTVDNLLQFKVTARLPGKMESSNDPSRVGNVSTWKAQLGQKVELLATSRAWNVTHIVEAAVLAFLLLVAAVVGLILIRLRRKGRKKKAHARK
jgi:hypothetical protein